MDSACKHVLIVDDDDEIRDSLSLILECEGFEAATASNGREALDYLKSHPRPCAILLDLMMPIMSGEQFREEQLREAQLAQIPTVVVSAGDNSNRVAQALGAQGFIRKPIDIEKLLGYLRDYCRT